MDQPRFMPLFQIPRFVGLIARRLPVSPCFDQDLRENFRERATSSFSLLDRNFLIHLYICVENCQYFSKRFDRIKNINSFSAVDLESSTKRFSTRVYLLIALLFLESRVWFAVACLLLSWLELIERFMGVWGTVVLRALFFLFAPETLNPCTNLPLEISKSFPYRWILLLKNMWQRSFPLPHLIKIIL